MLLTTRDGVSISEITREQYDALYELGCEVGWGSYKNIHELFWYVLTASNLSPPCRHPGRKYYVRVDSE